MSFKKIVFPILFNANIYPKSAPPNFTFLK